MFSILLSFANPTMNLIKDNRNNGCYTLQIKDETNVFGWHFNDLNDFMQTTQGIVSMRQEIVEILEKGK